MKDGIVVTNLVAEYVSTVTYLLSFDEVEETICEDPYPSTSGETRLPYTPL